MTQYSHSRVECFKACSFKYYLRYIRGFQVLEPTEADSPLILGTCLHTALEKGLAEALEQYKASYPIVTDQHILEMMKLEAVVPRAKEMLPKGGQFEVEVRTDDFLGYIDYLVPSRKRDGVNVAYDIWDFKYSNNIDGYLKSDQLHLYKFFFQKATGLCIDNTYFLFVPKANGKRWEGESLYDFRKRQVAEMQTAPIRKAVVPYDAEKVVEWLLGIKQIKEMEDKEMQVKKEKGRLCRFCEFQKYCEEGYNFMILPTIKRRKISKPTKRVLWIYGAPFTGKTVFANSFPDPLMLNTDGNIRFVDAPYIAIKDDVRLEGRMTKKTMAWEVFKEVVAELEKKNNAFKTIVVDLLEDLYEHCRQWIYQTNSITHESDDPYRAWDKVRSEFLATLRRLMNLDYENIILISHEDATKDLTKRNGDKVTSVKPNLQEKVALKVAGMVDVVARVVVDGEQRLFCFKSSENIFGGGRLKVTAKDIPLSVEELFKVYDAAAKKAVKGGDSVPAAPTQPTAPAAPARPTAPYTSADEQHPAEGSMRRAVRREAKVESGTVKADGTTTEQTKGGFERFAKAPTQQAQQAQQAQPTNLNESTNFDPLISSEGWEATGSNEPTGSGEAVSEEAAETLSESASEPVSEPAPAPATPRRRRRRE